MKITEPEVGHYLHASCSAEDYGRILAVGADENGAPTIDIEVLHPQDLISCDDDDDDEFESPTLTTLELPPGTKVILRNLQWRKLGDWDETISIVCNTPGNGCFRCTKLFSLQSEPCEE